MSITIVQSAQSASGTATFGASTTSGNCILACAADVGSLSTPSVTAVTLGGSAGNFASLISNTSSRTFAAIWADPNCAGGQTAVAITESNANHPAVIAYEINGLISSSVLDKSNPGTGSSATWSSGATAQTTQNNELVLGFVANSAALTAPGVPWSTLSQANSTTNSVSGIQIANNESAFTFNGTGTSGNWVALVVTLFGIGSGIPQVQVYWEAINRSSVW